MAWNNKVVWSEGMFIRPQHFQQQARYLEHYVENRCASLRNHAWGFKELTIDVQQLTLGKFSISSASGVFPDGTPFNIPEDDPAPPSFDVPENIRDMIVYLCIPIKRAGALEVDDAKEEESIARYRPIDEEIRDSNPGMVNVAQVQVAAMRTRLLLANENREEYACLGMARIVESRIDKNVILDEYYIPPVLDCQASAGLVGYLKELHGLLHHRGEALAARVAGSGNSGAAEIADFLLLQAVNRYEPLLTHLANLNGLHPESLYRIAVEITGELSTFTSKSKRPPELPAYLHEDLQVSFAPVLQTLRQSLSMVLEQNAVPIPMEERKYGIHVAPIADRTLLGRSVFVLAVNASMPTEDLRKRFPNLTKIGPVEQIRELVNLQLPGIRLRPLPVAPRQLPYHAGFVYFELDRKSEFWQRLKTSGGFALHLGGDFPGIQIQFWAIKG